MIPFRMERMNGKPVYLWTCSCGWHNISKLAYHVGVLCTGCVWRLSNAEDAKQ